MKEIIEIILLSGMLGITISLFVGVNKLAARSDMKEEKTEINAREDVKHCMENSERFSIGYLFAKIIPTDNKFRQKFNSNGPSSRKL